MGVAARFSPFMKSLWLLILLAASADAASRPNVLLILADHRGSGGNDYGEGALKPFAMPEADPEAPGQLYDLVADPGETTNLYSQKHEVVKELKALLERCKTTGRSRP